MKVINEPARHRGHLLAFLGLIFLLFTVHYFLGLCVSWPRHVLQSVCPIEQTDTAHQVLAWWCNLPCHIYCGRHLFMPPAVPFVRPLVFFSLLAGTFVHESARQAKQL